MPESTGLGEPVFTTVRSAFLLTVVSSVSELLPPAGSVSLPATEAVLFRFPVANGLTMMVTVAVLCLGRLPMLQMTVLVPLQLPWLGTAETKATVAGKLSVTTTPVAFEGPLLIMFRV